MRLAPAVEQTSAAPQQFLRARAVDHQVAHLRESFGFFLVRQQGRQRIARGDAEPSRRLAP